MSNQHEPPSQSGVELFQIKIPVNPSTWHPFEEEVLWASGLPEGQYRIENVPFFALSLSYHDIITADNKKGVLKIAEVKSRSGHSTYRCYLRKDVKDADFKEYFEPLGRLGCTYEKTINLIYSVNIPPSADYWKAYEMLQLGEMDKIWDFEEGHRGHVLD
jgi:hypothetical protein